jgi:hypothetical protein
MEQRMNVNLCVKLQKSHRVNVRDEFLVKPRMSKVQNNVDLLFRHQGYNPF